MTLLASLGMWLIYFIINTLSWAWIGLSLGTGILLAYKIFGGDFKKASDAIKAKNAKEKNTVETV